MSVFIVSIYGNARDIKIILDVRVLQQDVKPSRKDSDVSPRVHPVRTTMKNHFIEHNGRAGRGQKSARRSTTL